MENYTYNSATLTIQGLQVTEELMFPLFFSLFIPYVIIMLMNGGISLLIFIDKKLHQPIYLLLCNLTVSDMVGSTNVVPRLLADILQPPPERLVSYQACVVQAFNLQWFSTTSHTVLMVMAFDRYVAICNPLHYSVIMSSKMVMKLTLSAWGAAFALVAILLGLTVRLNRCRTLIANFHCDNASLFKLSCEDVTINNIYGLAFTVVLLASSIGTVVLTYSQIAVVCCTSRSKSLNSKALKTCSTHLVVYLIMLISGATVIVLHRFPGYSYYRKVSALLFLIIPAGLNPIIYGMQSKEIRRFLVDMFLSKKR